jgi:predicted NUDIX family NTP pyrophosphohydrolase
MRQVRTSAGILMYRRRAGGEGSDTLEVLLVHPGGPFFAGKDNGTWSVPKGILEKEGEDMLERAKTEFEEELGVALNAAGNFIDLGSVKQKGGKTVYAWAVEGDFVGPARSNTFRCEWPPRSGNWRTYPEIDRAEWFSFDEARSKINPAQSEFLDRLIEKLGNRGTHGPR